MDENVRRAIKNSIYRSTDKKLYDNTTVKKSQEGQDFIEINESELQTVLDNKPINKTVKVQEKVNVFRF